MVKIHPAAADHLPVFISAPGSTDLLIVVSAIFLIFAILGAGVFFLWLHSLPERLVHNRLQYDLVAVLVLLSLFTHVHALWVAALLLAFVKIPDMSRFDLLSPLHSIARSLRLLADQTGRPGVTAASAVLLPPSPSTSSTQLVTKEG